MNLNPIFKAISATATNFIRTDHAAVVSAFHRYKHDMEPKRKAALVETICLALTNHAQLEEEIFYPAVRDFAHGEVEKHIPEHAEMARLVAELRRMQPVDPGYEAKLMELMGKVLRHVADEETVVLPRADRELGRDRLIDLGARMSQRRLELMSPLGAGQLRHLARTIPPKALAASVGAVVLGGLLVARAWRRPTDG